MSRREVKGAFCPKCGKKLFRRKIKRNVPTTCNYCSFVIQNPREVFIPKSKYLEKQKELKNSATS